MATLRMLAYNISQYFYLNENFDIAESSPGVWLVSQTSSRATGNPAPDAWFRADMPNIDIPAYCKGVTTVTSQNGTFTSGFFNVEGAATPELNWNGAAPRSWNAQVCFWNSVTEPIFYITTTATGPGAISVDLGASVENNPGATYNFTVTPVDPISYKIVACDAPGAIVTDDQATFTITGSFANVPITVTTEAIATYSISATVTINTPTPAVDDSGAKAWVSFGEGANWEYLWNAGIPPYNNTDSGEATGIHAGDTAHIIAWAPNLACGIASFKKDGVEQLPGPDYFDWYMSFTMPSANVTFAIVMDVNSVTFEDPPGTNQEPTTTPIPEDWPVCPALTAIATITATGNPPVYTGGGTTIFTSVSTIPLVSSGVTLTSTTTGRLVELHTEPSALPDGSRELIQTPGSVFTSVEVYKISSMTTSTTETWGVAYGPAFMGKLHLSLKHTPS